jgi:sulfite oxidase
VTTHAPRHEYGDDGLNSGVTPAYTPDQLLTPTAHFFRRNHAVPPEIDPQSWRLHIDGLVSSPTELSLDALLTRFPLVDVTASLVCAGLRRQEFSALGSLNGELPWQADPISTARWSGIRLRDVVRAVGVSSNATHVHFVGLDAVERDNATFGFGASIDLAKAMTDDVLLATHMNGAPLLVAHGFPLRTMVPGYIGARSVKWLHRITLADAPSANYFQAKAYRVLRTPIAEAPRDVSTGVAMDGIPRNCVILDPHADARLAHGRCVVRGWAIGEGAGPLESVELSTDGVHWHDATITSPTTPWSWSFWEGVVPITPDTTTIYARATDALGTMPAALRDTWNVKGYGNNAWFRVTVHPTAGA